MPEMLLALFFGFKHGLDPDHLAVIDSLVRLIRERSPRTARFTGLLFSFGHSLAIGLFTCAAVLLSRFMEIKVPAWLEISGIALSASALILLALMNLASLKKRLPVSSPLSATTVASSHAAHCVPSKPKQSPMSSLKGGLNERATAWSVLLLGALFALSVDTITQATLFAGLAQGQLQDPAQVLLKGMLFSSVFGVGMMCADTVNGLFVNRLLDHLCAPVGQDSRLNGYQSRAKERALGFMTMSLSLLSLLVASLALAKLWLRELNRTNFMETLLASLNGQTLMLGLGAIAWVFLSYCIAASIAIHAGRAAPTS
jgi:nickel/cobalt transporter (NiCoT) family protein